MAHRLRPVLGREVPLFLGGIAQDGTAIMRREQAPKVGRCPRRYLKGHCGDSMVAEPGIAMPAIGEDRDVIVEADEGHVAMVIGREPLADPRVALVLSVGATRDDILVAALPSTIERRDVEPNDFVILNIPAFAIRDESPVDDAACHVAPSVSAAQELQRLCDPIRARASIPQEGFERRERAAHRAAQRRLVGA